MTSVSAPPTPGCKTDLSPISIPRNRYLSALDDLVDGFNRAWLWRALAMQDIRLRYRGSMLGPFWLTLSTTIMIGAMGVLYSKLFHMDTTAYFPFLAIGLVIWQFISTVITEGCNTFVAVQHLIQQAKMPYSTHAYRSVCRNLLVFAHSVVILPVVFLAVWHPVGWRALLAIPALAVLAINGMWISLLLGMLSARFRDVPPIVSSFLQVVFFVTPVFWMPDALGVWRQTAECNPLFAAIDIVRAPLLGLPTAIHSWSIMAGLTIGGVAVCFLLFARFRPRIAYWV